MANWYVARNSRLFRYGVITVVLIVLPSLLYGVYQVSMLTRTEQEITDAYKEQVGALLFSVNQQTEDVLSSWASRVEETFTPPPDTAALAAFARKNKPLRNVFAITPAGIASLRGGVLPGVLQAGSSAAGRLTGFRQAGYRKLEPVARDGSVLVFFAPEAGRGMPVLLCMEIAPVEFITRTLVPVVQRVAGSKFAISVLRDSGAAVVYANRQPAASAAPFTKPLWLLPGYSLGITLGEKSIADVVKERTRDNLLLVAAVNLVLLLGALLMYRGVTRELELARIRSDFVSNVSHELRTPLALIGMYAETLELGRVRNDEKKAEYYGIIARESRRLAGLVNSILNFSRMEAGKRKFSFAAVDPAGLVGALADTYRFHFAQKGFTLHASVAEQLPAVRADQEALSEAVINLLDNALKYSGTGRDIYLGAEEVDGWVTISVRDTGIGISAADQKHIFEKFFRAHTGDVHTVKGTGIGLSMVKQIIEAHGGACTVQSAPGSGSTFTLRLPKLQQDGNG